MDDQQRRGQQIGTAARTQPAQDELSVDLQRPRVPIPPTDTALAQELAGGHLREKHARFPGPVQQIGVLQFRDQSKAGVGTRRIPVAMRKAAPCSQGRQARTVDMRKTGGGFATRATSAIPKPHFTAVTLRWNGAVQNGTSPAVANKIAEAAAGKKTSLAAADRASRRAEQTQAKDGASVSINASRCLQHSPLRRPTDGAQFLHFRVGCAGFSKLFEVRSKRPGAGRKHSRIHVDMTAGVPVTDQTRLGPSIQFQ